MKTAMLSAAMLALVCSVPAHAAETREQTYRIGADVDSTGRITATQLDADVPASIGSVLSAAVKQWHFVPARHDGQPVPAHTFVYTQLKAIPDTHGGYSLRISFEGNGPRMLKQNIQPRYPMDAIRTRQCAFVVLDATVQPDGSLGDLSARSRFDDWPLRPSFIDSVLAAAKQWHAIPEQVNGQPVATRMHLSVSFILSEPIFTAKQTRILNQAARQETTDDARPGIPLPPDQVVALDSPLHPSAIATVTNAP